MIGNIINNVTMNMMDNYGVKAADAKKKIIE